MVRSKKRKSLKGAVTRILIKNLQTCSTDVMERVISVVGAGGIKAVRARGIAYRFLDEFAPDECRKSRVWVRSILQKRFGKKFYEDTPYYFSMYAWNFLASIRLLCDPRKLLKIAREALNRLASLNAFFELFRPWLYSIRSIFKQFKSWLKEWFKRLPSYQDILNSLSLTNLFQEA